MPVSPDCWGHTLTLTVGEYMRHILKRKKGWGEREKGKEVCCGAQWFSTKVWKRNFAFCPLTGMKESQIPNSWQCLSSQTPLTSRTSQSCLCWTLPACPPFVLVGCGMTVSVDAFLHPTHDPAGPLSEAGGGSWWWLQSCLWWEEGPSETYVWSVTSLLCLERCCLTQ